MKVPESNRRQFPGYQSNPGDPFGVFVFPSNSVTGLRAMKAIACDGLETGWDHVSVSLLEDRRCPSWKEMCFIKSQFWDDSECVAQFHPPASDNINHHPGCLHLWRWTKCEFPMPHKICV